MSLGLGVIGCGSVFAGPYRAMIERLRAEGRVHVSGLYDVDDAKRRGAAAYYDVDPALGDRLVLVWLGQTEDDAVLLTQADDEAKFQALVRKVAEKPVVFGEVDGWSAAAESQSAIDALDRGEAGRHGPNPDRFAYVPGS